MAEQAFLPVTRATQNKIPGPIELAPGFLDIAGSDRDAQPGVLASSSCAGAVPLVADDGDDYEMDEDFIRIMVGSGDRVAGFAYGVAIVALAGVFWIFA